MQWSGPIRLARKNDLLLRLLRVCVVLGGFPDRIQTFSRLFVLFKRRVLAKGQEGQLVDGDTLPSTHESQHISFQSIK